MTPELQCKVVGYFACITENQVLSDENACIIAGSGKTIKKYISYNSQLLSLKLQIKKARFGDIFAGMKHGGEYCFDSESFNRFYTLANDNGYDIENQEFPKTDNNEPSFVTVSWGRAKHITKKSR